VKGPFNILKNAVFLGKTIALWVVPDLQ